MTTGAAATARARANGRPQARRRLAVLVALARSDLRFRYGRGPARVLKWLLDPYAATGIYLLLIAFVLNRPGAAPGLSLACAVVPFHLVVSTVVNALSAIDRRHSVILNMAFDRMLIPVASTATEAVAFAASLTLIPAMMIAYGIAPTMAILWTPVLTAVTALFAVSLAFPAAIFGLWFYNVRNVAVSVVRAFFFLAPGLVPLAQIHGNMRTLFEVSPLTGLFESYRAVFLFGRSPSALDLGVPLAAAALLLALFVPLYRLEQTQLAKIVEIE